MPSTEKIVKAKKNHKCTQCSCDINTGMLYLMVKIAWFKNYNDCDDTGFKVMRFCEKCNEPDDE